MEKIKNFIREVLLFKQFKGLITIMECWGGVHFLAGVLKEGCWKKNYVLVWVVLMLSLISFVVGQCQVGCFWS